MHNIMNRRDFVKICTTTATAVVTSPEVLAQPDAAHVLVERVRLVDSEGAPMTTASLEAGEAYLFFFPHVTTPCFLIDLGRPVTTKQTLRTKNSVSYVWPGGVGRNQSIVSFSAICAHRMTHPAPEVSFISYRHGKVEFTGKDYDVQNHTGVIYCCSEGSVYDPARGGHVLGGPAPQPLATILLDYDSTQDTLSAYGVLGGNMFEPYFKKFWHRLELSFGVRNVRAQAQGTTRVIKASDFSASQVMC